MSEQGGDRPRDRRAPRSLQPRSASSRRLRCQCHGEISPGNERTSNVNRRCASDGNHRRDLHAFPPWMRPSPRRVLPGQAAPSAADGIFGRDRQERSPLGGPGRHDPQRRRADRPKRPLPVRQRQEAQEVLREIGRFPCARTRYPTVPPTSSPAWTSRISRFPSCSGSSATPTAIRSISSAAAPGGMWTAGREREKVGNRGERSRDRVTAPPTAHGKRRPA
jgi:hypothetical protein